MLGNRPLTVGDCVQVAAGSLTVGTPGDLESFCSHGGDGDRGAVKAVSEVRGKIAVTVLFDNHTKSGITHSVWGHSLRRAGSWNALPEREALRHAGTERPICGFQEDSVLGDIGGACRREPGHDGMHDSFAQSARPTREFPWRTGRPCEDWRPGRERALGQAPAQRSPVRSCATIPDWYRRPMAQRSRGSDPARRGRTAG